MKRALLAQLLSLLITGAFAQASPTQSYDYDDTQKLVTLVSDAAALVQTKGEAAFSDFRVPNSRWRTGESYIFVLDPQGNMLVHPDPALEVKNQLDLKDVNGKQVTRGLLDTAEGTPQHAGWYHYQWPVAGGIFPRWKSSYVMLVKAPSGKNYIVGSGIYNDRMERAFVMDAVQKAVALIEKTGTASFGAFHDPTSPFMAKDAYIFVIDPKGVELVNPAFPNLEGRNLMDLKDTQGKELVKEMFKAVEKNGSAWVDYMWPKPGEGVSTQKSAYVSKAKVGDSWLLVGCGVYLADAPKAASDGKTMTAQELMTLVREAATIFAKDGEKAYSDFRVKGSKWFQGDTYFFVWSLEGTRIFHAANPKGEGLNLRDVKDIVGRPWGKMILNAASSEKGEGWVHYMYPEPGNIFPIWKSTFVKKVIFPSGTPYIIGCGIYNMKMDRAFIEDVVNRAAAIVAEQGKNAFSQLRDKTGPFVFMDTYVFVEALDGTELVNAALPSLEGKNLIDLKDAKGKEVAKDEIAAAIRDGSAWMKVYWYKPGDNMPAPKETYVRKVQSGDATYILGSGFYVDE